MSVRTPIVALLIILVTASQSFAERLPLPLPLPKGLQDCALKGWAFSNGLEDVVLRDGPHKDSKMIGIVLEAMPSRSGSQEQSLYPVHLEITQYENGWMKVSSLKDQVNDGKARSLPSPPGWIPANAIRFKLQSGNGYLAPDSTSKVLIDLNGQSATEIGQIEQVEACQGDWVLLAYRQKLTRGADGALIPLTEERQFRKQAWFRNTCGDFLTTCDRGSVDLHRFCSGQMLMLCSRVLEGRG